VRGLWEKGTAAVDKHSLLSLETADLNDAQVSSRFIEVKKSLQDALQTDIANSGTSHAESLDGETDGLASRCARWIYAASLSEVHPEVSPMQSWQNIWWHQGSPLPGCRRP
jgi:hypothetical protein